MIDHTPSAAAFGFATIPFVAWLILFFRKPLIASAITVAALTIVWLAFAQSSQTAIAQTAPAPAAPVLPDMHHLAKIFDAWAMHSNFVALCMTIIVGVVAWMAIKITKLHVENPRHVYYDPRALGHEQVTTSPPLLERTREEEYRGKLPVVRSREI